MNLIDLIMRLLYEFVPMESAEFAKIKDEAKQWYISIRIDDEAQSGLNGINLYLSKAKDICEKWYAKAFFAVMYLYGKRQITLYTNPTFKQDQEDDED